MCLFVRRTSGGPRSLTLRGVIPDRWSDRAQCGIATYLQHSYSGNKLCADCYIYQPTEDRADYRVTTRHFINFGVGPRRWIGFEVCTSCCVILGDFSDINSCRSCLEFKESYLIHLAETGEQPWLDEEPTSVSYSIRQECSGFLWRECTSSSSQ